MVKTSKRKTHKRRSMKGGSGILTYPLNLYQPDTQLQDNMITSRQMYTDQTVANSRFLTGGGNRRRKTEKKKGGKKTKSGNIPRK